MTPAAIKCAYIAVSLAIAAAVTYALMLVGLSLWSAAVAAYMLFFVVNGALVYGLRARKMRAQGETPPPFLVFLFFPRGPTERVAVSRPVRVALGIVFLLGTAFFVAGATAFGLQADFSQAKHAIQGGAVILMLLAAGGAIGYVGFRLMFVTDDEPLLGRRRPSTNSPR